MNSTALTKPAVEYFYFYDYETFGQSPCYDRPAQFAGLRTDSAFNPISEPVVIYCKPPPDYLPDPHAILINGITPQQALAQGVSEAEFAKRIQSELSYPYSCIVGYNNIRFDDEVTRYLFYRNFYDPYSYAWQHGNSRWDLLDIARACYVLRPEGMIWPSNAQQRPSLKLEHLSKANGIPHTDAHDALSDVYATIALAKQLCHAQPRLFHYLLQLRHKYKAAALIDILNFKPLLHISGLFGAQRGYTSWIVPLFWHPDNQNTVVACDLAGNITALLEQPSEILSQYLYKSPMDKDPHASTIPLTTIYLNRCPILAPANSLSPCQIERLGLDRQHCINNLKKLRTAPQLRSKIANLLWQRWSPPPTQDVEGRLYEGFFSASDRKYMEQIHQTDPKALSQLYSYFQDSRIAPLLFRYRARNFPHTLSPSEQQQWLHHRQRYLQARSHAYFNKLQQLMQEYAAQAEKFQQLQAVWDYTQQLMHESNLRMDITMHRCAIK